MEVPKVLILSGLDPSGGAGLIADVRTVSALGVYPLSVPTCLTVQSTQGLKRVVPVDPQLFLEMVEEVVADSGVSVAKVGALGSGEIAKAVSTVIESRGLKAVVDPIAAASSGAPLVDEDGWRILLERIVPSSLVVTPNRIEAEKIAGERIETLSDAVRVAKKILRDLGPRSVLLKGGHLGGDEVVDVLVVDESVRLFKRGRRPVDPHGTGCVLSSAIAAGLARGLGIEESVELAERVVEAAIDFSLSIGKGRPCTNPLALLEIDAYRYRALESVRRAVDELLSMETRLSKYVAEVGMNVGEALPPPYARTTSDVAAVLGRIVRAGRRLVRVGDIVFGASSHVARALLTAMKLDPRIRAAANLRYSPQLVEAARRLGMSVVFVDRRREPEEFRNVEGGSMEWIVSEAHRLHGSVPDIVYDRGDVGKEPMVRVFGSSAIEVAEKIRRILEEIERGS